MKAAVVIVGGGAGAAAAALRLTQRGIRPLVLDVGQRPDSDPPLSENWYDLRRKDSQQADYLIGSSGESLRNLYLDYLTPKLKGPRFRFVLRGGIHSPLVGEGFYPLQSFSLGGLANAWGAGVYRYTQDDLAEFPLGEAELAPYYDRLTTEMGVSGEADDLLPFFGAAEGLQPPFPLDPIGSALAKGYSKRRVFFNEHGVSVGRPRLAILSKPMGDRPACPRDNLCFWQPWLPSIYTPAYTLMRLSREGRIDYQPGRLAVSFSQNEEGVAIRTRSLIQKEAEQIFHARYVLLAAGTLNSARIVLASRRDHVSTLPLLENTTSLTPFFYPPLFGTPIAKESHGLIQLNLIYNGLAWPERVQGSFYGYSSLLLSEILSRIPLAARSALGVGKYLPSALGILQLFYPDHAHPKKTVRWAQEGALHVACHVRPTLGAVEKEMVRLFRSLGFLSSSFLVQYPPPGNGIHYAGTLPMKAHPSGPYETSSSGQLSFAPRVFVADASVFPRLPAKNHTMTLMALAMRAANRVADQLKGLS